MKEQGPLYTALSRLLRPLARMLLRNGVSYKAFAELSKRVFVEVAREEFRIPGRKQSDSRVSVITGLSRKEVKRVQTDGNDDEANLRLYNRAARVIYGWVNDPEYHDGSGNPRRLPMEQGPNGMDFVSLVRRYSGDAPPRAVLDELDRVHAIRRHDDGYLSLQAHEYAPPMEARPDRLKFLGEAGSALIDSVDRAWQDEKTAQLQHQVCVITDEAGLREFRNRINELGQQVGEKVQDNLPASVDSRDDAAAEVGVVLLGYER